MPPSPPRVVILLATWNGAGFLAEQLQSFRTQTHAGWQLLVSDDGSSDGTIALLEDFAARVPQRVEILRGPGKSFWQNFVALVRSTRLDAEFDAELIAYSDQDDVWKDEKLGKAVAWFSAVPRGKPALYFTRTELIEQDGTPIGLSPLFTRAPRFENAMVQNIGGGNTMVFNRAALAVLRTTPADAAIVSHDWWTYQVIAGVGGIAHYDAWPSLKYRQHPQNIVGANAGPRARLVRLRAFARGRVKSWNDVNTATLFRLRGMLTPRNARVLELFMQARRAPLPSRIPLLWRSGVYRQSPLESLGLFIAVLFGRL